VTRIAAVLTAYNRREMTLACLRSLRAQAGEDVLLDIVVVDDASTDGTSDALAAEFPDVAVLQGDGQLYWNGGMIRAFAAAIERDYDAYLWMNDDTTLDDDALARLVRTWRTLEARGEPAAIVVGTTRDPHSGALTYGGRTRRNPSRPLQFDMVEPGDDEPQPCETMNGNCVLIPRAVVARVGNLDPGYRQKMGDLDYGLRAQREGCSVWVAPGTVGTCPRNQMRSTREAPLMDEIRHLWSIKELPPRSWARFARRWGGGLWALRWLSPYVRRGWRLAVERTPLRRLIHAVPVQLL
jgi:GT2 family glycosyltransferase